MEIDNIDSLNDEEIKEKPQIISNELEEQLECGICKNYPARNVECPKCSMVVCTQCLFNWAEASNKNAPQAKRRDQLTCTCPTCRATTLASDWKHNIALQRVINSVKVGCDYCDQSIQFGDLDVHIVRNCPRYVVNCTNECCQVKLERRCLKEHMESQCEFRLVICYCRKEVLFRDLQSHQDSMCMFAEELDPLIALTKESLEIAKKHAQDTPDKIEELSHVLRELTKPFLVAVVGEFNNGKTLFVNALLGQQLLRVKPTPTTAVNCAIRFKDIADLLDGEYNYYKQESDESPEELITKQAFEQLAYLNSKEDPELNGFSRPSKLVIEGKIEMLRKTRVELMDTRGVGEIGFNSLDVLDLADASILIVDANKICSERTIELYRQVKDKTGQASCFVVVNKCDTLDEDELQTIKSDAKDYFGDDIRGFISAKKALAGDPQWKAPFQRVVIDLGVFLQQNPVKGRIQKFSAKVSKLNKEMSYIQLVKESDSISLKLTNELLRSVLQGIDKFNIESASNLAERYIPNYTTDDECVDALISWQMWINSGTGFVTGLGGFLSLIVTIPSGLLAMWFVGARLAASIAYVYGHDIADPTIQEMIILCLLGEHSVEELRKRIAENKVLTDIKAITPVAFGHVCRASGITIANKVIREVTEESAKVAARQVARNTFRSTLKSALKTSTKEAAHHVAVQQMQAVYTKTLAEETAKALGQKLIGQISYRTVQRAIPLISGAISGILDMSYSRRVGLFAKDVFRNFGRQ